MSSNLTIDDVFISSNNGFYRIPSLVQTPDGDILAFANRRLHTVADSAKEVDFVMRRWCQKTGRWLEIENLFSRPHWHTAIGTALLDECNNTILVSYYRSPVNNHSAVDDPPSGHFLAISSDNGHSWHHKALTINPNSLNMRGSSHGASPGITLRFGSRKGRLIAPARIADKPDEEIETLQNHHYNCAVFSDDGGLTWQTSEPVQVGTGEGCLAELSDGRIYYNSRAYFLDGRRRIAWSYDGGETFKDFTVESALSEPTQGGCNASLVRIPGTRPEEKDLLLIRALISVHMLYSVHE